MTRAERVAELRVLIARYGVANHWAGALAASDLDSRAEASAERAAAALAKINEHLDALAATLE